MTAIYGLASPNDPCFPSGTDGSNPFSSTGESLANLTSGPDGQQGQPQHHTRVKSLAFRLTRGISRETRTVRWREADSNHRSQSNSAGMWKPGIGGKGEGNGVPVIGVPAVQ